jgi:hypothetical protein
MREKCTKMIIDMEMRNSRISCWVKLLAPLDSTHIGPDSAPTLFSERLSLVSVTYITVSLGTLGHAGLGWRGWGPWGMSKHLPMTRK